MYVQLTLKVEDFSKTIISIGYLLSIIKLERILSLLYILPSD